MAHRWLGAILLAVSLAGCGTSTNSTSESQPDAIPSATSSESIVDDDLARPTLQRGDEGPWVIELQRALTSHGFPLDDDGDFGATTETAVRDFQTANGLTVDGVVGSETWDALASPVTAPPATASLVLAANGLGAVSFGDSADQVLAVLTATLGPPDEEYRPNDPDSIVYRWYGGPQGYALGVWVGKTTTDCSDYSYRDDGIEHFYAWDYRGGLGLATANGVTVGSTTAEVSAAYPDAEFGQHGVSGSADWSPGLVLMDGGDLGLGGGVMTADLEPIVVQALVERGVPVESPGGVFEALRAFQTSEGLVVSGGLDSPTWLALGLPLPADSESPVVALWAGNTYCAFAS